MDTALRISGTKIIIVAAIADNGAIGQGGKLPWQLPSDMSRFKKITDRTGLVIMGGETFRSILKQNGKPLRGRMSIVLSLSLEYNDKEVIIVRNLEELKAFVSQENMGEVAIIGGESIYKLFAPIADELHITHVHTEVEADRFFPFSDFDFPASWEILYEERRNQGKDDYPTTYRVYRQRQQRQDQSFVNLANGREPEQIRVMERIQESGFCPFCEENLLMNHKKPILQRGTHWLVTENQWPYKESRRHFLIIARRHAERLSDLPAEAGAELLSLCQALEQEHDISGGLCIRFGNPEVTGATVKHLHCHLLEPERDEPLRFWISGGGKKKPPSS